MKLMLLTLTDEADVTTEDEATVAVDSTADELAAGETVTVARTGAALEAEAETDDEAEAVAGRAGSDEAAAEVDSLVDVLEVAAADEAALEAEPILLPDPEGALDEGARPTAGAPFSE